MEVPGVVLGLLPFLDIRRYVLLHPRPHLLAEAAVVLCVWVGQLQSIHGREREGHTERRLESASVPIGLCIGHVVLTKGSGEESSRGLTLGRLRAADRANEKALLILREHLLHIVEGIELVSGVLATILDEHVGSARVKLGEFAHVVHLPVEDHPAVSLLVMSGNFTSLEDLHRGKERRRARSNCARQSRAYV